MAEKRDIIGECKRCLKQRWAEFLLLVLLLVLALVIGVLFYFRWFPWLTVLASTLWLALLLFLLGRVVSSPWSFVGLLVVAILVYAGSLSYQAGAPARIPHYQAWVKPQLPNISETITLTIVYPSIIPLEAPDKPGWPISVYLWPPVLSMTPTVTETPPSTTPAPTLSAHPEQTTTPTVTETAPASASTTITTTSAPTFTQRISYIVAFEPCAYGLLFTDEEGVPVAPQVMVESGQPPDKPAVLYIRRAPTATLPISVSVTVEIYGPDGRPQKLPSILEVRLEEDYNAWWRHFWDLVFGPTTPMLALAAALVGFGWQWWQEGTKRKQAQLDEIEHIRTLPSQGKLEEAKLKLQEVTSKYSRESGLRSELDKTRKHVRLAQINLIREVLAATEPYEAYCQCQDLKKLREDENWTDPELIASLEGVEAAIQHKPLSPPELWPDKAQRRDSPAITAWIESGKDLRFNPFGPERAEEDPLLPQLFVKPPGWDAMKALEPTVIFGASGSGRTAALLLLAHTCMTTALGLDHIGGQVDTFPVRLALFPEGKPDEAAVTCWRMLTSALVQAVLDFLARNPQTFAETPYRQRRALTRLFAMHKHRLGDLAAYLSGVGLDRPVAMHLAENIQQGAQGTRPPSLTDEAELLATMAEARLSSFQQYYFLVEVPDEASTRFQPEEIVPHLKSLMQIMGPLAARKIYLKLFTPENARGPLGPLPSQASEVRLLWEPQALLEMLEWRVQQAGAASFKALFRHLPEGVDPAAFIVQAALKSEGPPRRLIKLGQELLAEHIRLAQEKNAPIEPQLRWEELEAVLEKSAQGSGL